LSADLTADLKRAIATLASSGDPAQLRIADGLALWLESESTTLEAALGVAPTLRGAMRRRRRDALYAEIAQTLFPELSGWPLARAITTAVSRYRTGQWRHDRDNGRRPAGSNGLMFDLLKLGERLLDQEALRRLPGIFRAREYPSAAVGSSRAREETCLERDGRDGSVFEGSKSGSASDC
jgi:hypothetical protein